MQPPAHRPRRRNAVYGLLHLLRIDRNARVVGDRDGGGEGEALGYIVFVASQDIEEGMAGIELLDDRGEVVAMGVIERSLRSQINSSRRAR